MLRYALEIIFFPYDITSDAVNFYEFVTRPMVNIRFFESCYYNSTSLEKRCYYSSIRRSAIIILSLSHPCHFLRRPLRRAHRQPHMSIETHTDVKFRLLPSNRACPRTPSLAALASPCPGPPLHLAMDLPSWCCSGYRGRGRRAPSLCSTPHARATGRS
jgi:hypothetical protein